MNVKRGENNMYIVIYKKTLNIPIVIEFEYLDEAQEFIKGLAQQCITNVSLSQEIPFKLKIDVEF